MSEHNDAIKQPKNLSPRVQWLRDYFFEGTEREWNNEYNVFTNGNDWDRCFDELSYYIVPETKAFFQPFTTGFVASGKVVPVDKDFFKLSIVERKALYEKEIIINQIPKEILPGDLLCGARFNAMYSMCLTKKEAKEREKMVLNARKEICYLIEHGYGNAGATSGHLVPDYAKIVKNGFKAVYEDLQNKYDALSSADQKGQKGAQLRAMMTACTIPKELAEKYREECLKRVESETDEKRKAELKVMADNLSVVPWNGAENFYQAIQSLWLTHMLVMFDEKYPGPGVSFGRIDQFLYPYYAKSVADGMDRDFMKEILGCFWVHCNTVYDAQIRIGANQGITAGFGQLFNLSGIGKDGEDTTNDLTYLFLDVIDDMSPILEPKPNVRLHRNTPEELLDRVVDMVSTSQGAPFLLNFDERSMAGLMRQAKVAGVEEYINKDNIHDYVSVGCLENTMAGNDRSGTVDVNVNLLKAM
ncbi:MAG: pyruvate formate lyase family protein, partial [Clostridia bacterium]|nr:pyruvate formate lyase family protein [Clostridia bacterium]